MAKKEFITKLTSLKGIGEAKAEALYDNGYDTIKKLTSASIEDLTKVDGISESVAKSIQKQLKSAPSSKKVTKKPTEKPAKKESKKPEKKDVKGSEEKPKEDTPSKKKEKVIKKKPDLPESLGKSLEIRKELKKRTPDFKREEWFRYKRLGTSWRRPDGITSKMRRNFKYRPNKVRVGYRGPVKTRGLHPSGFEEIMVYSITDLDSINPKTQAARIGSTVGTRKRLDIEKKAKELDIRLLNI